MCAGVAGSQNVPTVLCRNAEGDGVVIVVRQFRAVLSVVSSICVFACGAPPQEAELTLELEEGAPTCAKPSGRYKATFTLRETQGACSDAKAESHDALEFDEHGVYLSPVDDLVTCQTLQEGCQLAVRCTTEAMRAARADMIAELNPDASHLAGVATVVGSYRGCESVTYDFVAWRAQ